MRKIGSLTIIGIAIVVIVGVIFYYEEIREVKVEIPKTNVVVAKKDIPENTVITEDMITVDKRYTKDLLKQKGNITSHIEKVLGKRTRVPLYKNETIKLDRLLNNEPYMNDDYGKKQIEIALYPIDKALNIKKGSFIDIWLEPTEAGIAKAQEQEATTNVPEDEKIKVRKLFEKLQVVTVDNGNFEDIDEKVVKANEKTDEEGVNVPVVITVELYDEDIEKILSIDDTLYNFRVTLYSENKHYKILGDVLERTKKEIEKRNEVKEEPTN